MHLLDLLPGIIWAAFLGLVIGNYSTSPIYRLPRNESLFNKDPYCGDCNAKLMPRDLFPVFSWLLTRGRCRYCGAAVPGSYTVIEAFVGLLFVLCYLQWGFSEQFILIAFGMTTFAMLAVMLHLDNFFSGRTLIACLIFGMLHRTLQDGTIYNFAGSGFAGLFIAVAIWKFSKEPLIRDVNAFPAYVKLLVASGVWLSLLQLFALAIAVLIVMPFYKGKDNFLSYVIIASTMALTLIHI